MTQIAQLSKAKTMLQEARTVAEFRDLRDFASSMREWARAHGLGIEAENEACAFVLRAEREIGRELLRMAEAGERAVYGRFIVDQPRDENGRVLKGAKSPLPTLRDLGISLTNAANWQRLAGIEDEYFERMIAQALAPDANGKVRRIAKKRFYPWPEDRRGPHHGSDYRKDDPLTPLFHLRTYADQVLGSSLSRLSSDDLIEVGKIGVNLVKAARAELDGRQGRAA